MAAAIPDRKRETKKGTERNAFESPNNQFAQRLMSGSNEAERDPRGVEFAFRIRRVGESKLIYRGGGGGGREADEAGEGKATLRWVLEAQATASGQAGGVPGRCGFAGPLDRGVRVISNR